MKKYVLDLTVVSVERIHARYVLIRLTDTKPLPEMLPGQFVEVRVDSSPSTFLRRPISINYVDRDWEDGSRLPLTTGVTVDDQAPTLDDVLQTNFYGQNDYEIPWTLFSNQIDVAFQGPDELGAFVTGKLQNISDQTEQKHVSTVAIH